jgi:hypothetical protein
MSINTIGDQMLTARSTDMAEPPPEANIGRVKPSNAAAVIADKILIENADKFDSRATIKDFDKTTTYCNRDKQGNVSAYHEDGAYDEWSTTYTFGRSEQGKINKITVVNEDRMSRSRPVTTTEWTRNETTGKWECQPPEMVDTGFMRHVRHGKARQEDFGDVTVDDNGIHMSGKAKPNDLHGNVDYRNKIDGIQFPIDKLFPDRLEGKPGRLEEILHDKPSDASENLDLRLESDKAAEAKAVVDALAKGEVKSALKMLKDAPDQADLVKRVNESLKEDGIKMQVAKDALYIRHRNDGRLSALLGDETVKIPMNGDSPTAERKSIFDEKPVPCDGKMALDSTISAIRRAHEETAKAEAIATGLENTHGFPDAATQEKIQAMFKQAYESGGADGANRAEQRINNALKESGLTVDVRRLPFNKGMLSVGINKDGERLAHPPYGVPVSVLVETSGYQSIEDYSPQIKPHSHRGDDVPSGSAEFIDVPPFRDSLDSAARELARQAALWQAAEEAGYTLVHDLNGWRSP